MNSAKYEFMRSTPLFFAVVVASLIITGPARRLMAADLTNTVPVTEKLFFSLRKRFDPLSNEFSASESIGYVITASATNHEIVYRYFPAERSYVFRLLEANDTEVKKTARGLEYSNTPHIPTNIVESSKLRGYDMSRGGDLFRPDDMFVIKNKGQYELEISVRLWVQTTNTGAPNELSQFTQPGIGTNYQFGVVTSPPVRVKIIKE